MNPGKDSRKRLRPRLAGVSSEKRRKLDLSQPQERQQQQQRGRELSVAEDGAFEPRAKSGGRAWLRAKQTGESEPTQPRPQLSAAHRLPPPPGAPPAKTKNKNETTITPPPPLGGSNAPSNNNNNNHINNIIPSHTKGKASTAESSVRHNPRPKRTNAGKHTEIWRNEWKAN